MRTTHFCDAGLLTLTAALVITLAPEVQEGRAFGAGERPTGEAEADQRARGTGMQPSEHILSAQFQAAVYEVQAPAEQLSILDEKALTSQAATPEQLLSALAQTGKARMRYQVDQPVNVFSTMCMAGSSEPVVTGTRMTARSNAVNSISYQNVGFIVRLSAQGPPNGEPSAAPIVKTAIRLSVLSPGEKEIAEGQRESVARAVTLDHSESFALNQPRVLVAISSNAFSRFQTTAEGSGRSAAPLAPLAYVVRYLFRPLAQSGVAGSGPAKIGTTTPETAQSTNSLTARFQATIYELDAATNMLPTLDAEALARSATPELLLNTLSSAGRPRVLYRIDQPVNVFSDQVEITTNKPVATSTRMGREGKAMNSYTYQKLGVRIAFSAQAPPKDAGRQEPNVMISFSMSADVPSNTELGLGQATESFVNVSEEYNEPLELGRSRIMLAAGSPSAAEQAKPFVYVVRYQFDPPETK